MSELFSERLKRLRTARGMNKTQLAARVGVTNVTVHWWENEASQPRLDKIERLARALGVTATYLVTGRDAPELAAIHAAIRQRAPYERLLAMVPPV